MYISLTRALSVCMYIYACGLRACVCIGVCARRTNASTCLAQEVNLFSYGNLVMLGMCVCRWCWCVCGGGVDHACACAPCVQSRDGQLHRGAGRGNLTPAPRPILLPIPSLLPAFTRLPAIHRGACEGNGLFPSLSFSLHNLTPSFPSATTFTRWPDVSDYVALISTALDPRS
jgi:hypothetical protein